MTAPSANILKDARRRSPATVEQVRHAIDRLEAYTGFKDFGTFNKEQARGFKRASLGSRAKRSGKPISTATAHHVLQAVKEFLAWLRRRPGYRRRIDLMDYWALPRPAITVTWRT